MELGWGTLVLIVVAAAGFWFLRDSLAARERANAAAIQACQRLSLHFLDGTVAFTRLSFAREHGQRGIRRTYVFDYTANSIERRQGFVILFGQRVESVGYAPGEERRRQPETVVPTMSVSATFTPLPPPPAEPPAPEPVESAQVFDLADWRARRREAEQQQSPSQRRTGVTDHGNGQDHHH